MVVSGDPTTQPVMWVRDDVSVAYGPEPTQETFRALWQMSHPAAQGEVPYAIWELANSRIDGDGQMHMGYGIPPTPTAFESPQHLVYRGIQTARLYIYLTWAFALVAIFIVGVISALLDGIVGYFTGATPLGANGYGPPGDDVTVPNQPWENGLIWAVCAAAIVAIVIFAIKMTKYYLVDQSLAIWQDSKNRTALAVGSVDAQTRLDDTWANTHITGRDCDACAGHATIVYDSALHDAYCLNCRRNWSVRYMPERLIP